MFNKFRFIAAAAVLGAAFLGTSLVQAVPQTPQQQFAALRDKYVAQIQPLDQELPYAAGMVIKKKKKNLHIQ